MKFLLPSSAMEATRQRWIIRTSPALSSDRDRLLRLPLTLPTDRAMLWRFIRTSKREAVHQVRLVEEDPTATESWHLRDKEQLVRPLRHYIPIPFPTAVLRLRPNGRTNRLLRCKTQSCILNSNKAVTIAWPLRRTTIPPRHLLPPRPIPPTLG